MISTLTTTKEGGCKSKPDKIKNNKIYSTILEGTENTQDANESSRTELDSHANMPVIAMNAYILSKIGETVDVAPFTPDYKPISVELVDAALKYECPYSREINILIIRRGLYVPSMTHNLLPPFMLREAGFNINEVPKIHVTLPTEEHHAITFQETIFSNSSITTWHILLFSHQQAKYSRTGRTRGCICLDTHNLESTF